MRYDLSFKDKSESTWDHMTHLWPDLIVDKTNADVAANSYYMYKNDIDLVKQLGVSFINNYFKLLANR